MGRRLALVLALACWLPAAGARGEPLPPPLEVREGWLEAQELFQLPEWVELGLAFTAEPLVNPSGGLVQQGSWVQQTSAALAVGTGLGKPHAQWREADHWRLHLNLNHYSGNPDYNLALGALFPLQEAAFPSGFWLSEASVARHRGEGWWGFKAGVVALNPEFVAAPVLDYYVHSALNNTLNITLNDLPINPYAAAGGIVTLQPARELTLRYGLFNLETTLPIARWLGVEPQGAATSGWAQLLQLSYTPPWLAPKTDTPLLACRRGAGGLVPARPGCRERVPVQRQLPEGLLQLGAYSAPSEGQGVYGTVTWAVPLPVGLDNRLWLGGHASGEPSDGSDGGELSPEFLGGGLVSQGLLPGRPLDVLVLGLGRSSLNGPASGLPAGSYEGVIELGYQLQVNRSLALQPTLQWIVNPGGTNQVPGVLAAGLQLSLSF